MKVRALLLWVGVVAAFVAGGESQPKTWRLESPNGLIVDVSNVGGRVIRVYAPDRFGNLVDVALGCNALEDYASLNLPGGWDTNVWTGVQTGRGTVKTLELTRVESAAGAPGAVVQKKAIYRVLPNNTLTVDLEEHTNVQTTAEPVWTLGFNLAGEANGTIAGQQLEVFVEKAGKVAFKSLEKPRDFVSQKDAGSLEHQLTWSDPSSGRQLDVWATSPILRLSGSPDGLLAKAWLRTLNRFAGLMIETRGDQVEVTDKKPLYFHTEYRFTTK